jgi:hypothetical protein
MKRTATFELWKDKKLKLLYGEINDGTTPPMLQKLEIPKYIFGGKVPQKIEVSIEYSEDVKNPRKVSSH